MVKIIVGIISRLTNLTIRAINVLADAAERIAVQGESLLFTLFSWLYRMRELILVELIQRYWPRALTANVLTTSRVVIGIVIAGILFYESDEHNGLVASLFGLGLITEVLDGSVARALQPNRSAKRAAFGSFFDKFADRALYIPLAWFEYWPHPEFWVRFILVGAIAGGLIALFWQFINWVCEEPREVPENFSSKVSAVCYIPVVFIPLLWPDQWRYGFYVSLAATVLAVGSLWKGLKAIFFIMMEEKNIEKKSDA